MRKRLGTIKKVKADKESPRQTLEGGGEHSQGESLLHLKILE